MPLNANALVSVAQAKSELSIPTLDTSQDVKLEEYINAASDFVENVTGRKIKDTAHTQYFDPTCTAFLLLREYPVTGTPVVHIDDEWAFGGATQVTPGTFKIDREVGLARQRGTWNARNPQSVKVVYNAGHSTVPVDLQQAALLLVTLLYRTRGDRRLGVEQKSKMSDSASFQTDVPQSILMLIEPHKRANYIKARLEPLPDVPKQRL